MSHREPVNSVSSERNGCHVQRSRISKHIEPGQTDHQVNTREELHESRHPESPHAHGAIHLGAQLRKVKECLATPDEVSDAKAKKTDGDRQKAEFANLTASVPISTSQSSTAVIVACNCSTTFRGRKTHVPSD